MTRLPACWTRDELDRDARVSATQFRDERLLAGDAWNLHYEASQAKFKLLFETLGNLEPTAVTDQGLAKVYRTDLGEALRYLAGPPISDDDLRVLADVKSLAPGVVSADASALRQVFEVIERVIDPHRFPWIKAGKAPTKQQREAALLASSVLLAAQRIATERRMDGKESQEFKVKEYLRQQGFSEVSPTRVNTIVHGPQAGQFCAECQLRERKADVVVRLHDTRLLAIECKVSNSATNSVKRLNNDAAVKAEYWLKEFGKAQVVPAAMLSGIFKIKNLEQAQARGLALFWAHDLDKLGAFIESTRR